MTAWATPSRRSAMRARRSVRSFSEPEAVTWPSPCFPISVFRFRAKAASPSLPYVGPGEGCPAEASLAQRERQRKGDVAGQTGEEGTTLRLMPGASRLPKGRELIEKGVALRAGSRRAGLLRAPLSLGIAVTR